MRSYVSVFVVYEYLTLSPLLDPFPDAQKRIPTESNSSGYRVDDLSHIGHAQDQINYRDCVINRIVPGVNRNDPIGRSHLEPVGFQPCLGSELIQY